MGLLVRVLQSQWQQFSGWCLALWAEPFFLEWVSSSLLYCKYNRSREVSFFSSSLHFAVLMMALEVTIASNWRLSAKHEYRTIVFGFVD